MALQKGKLSASRVMQNGKVAIRLAVLGNVGAEGREILDELGLTRVADIANCREIFVTTPADLDRVRDALVARGVVDRPAA